MADKIFEIDTNQIEDWDAFHNYFSTRMGFPDFYGRNMDAWIDCLTSIDHPEEGMTSIHIAPGSHLVFRLTDAKSFKARCPDLYDALIECSAFVNHRRLATGKHAVLTLSF